MKKRILLLSLACIFALASCDAPEDGGGGGGTPSPQDEYYTITWKNWNGEVLETDTNVKKGTMPSYDGATPTKAEDSQYTYTFESWTPTVVAAVADATYTATFTANEKQVTPETYTITWVNWNGAVLETDRNVVKGTVPTYDGATPTRPEDSQYTYTFTGRNPTVVAAVANTTYTAQYRSTPKEVTPETYTITWKNWDGTVLETDRNVAKNTMPTYDGATPTKPEDEQYTYTFNGWNPTVVVAVADASYTAQFKATAKEQQQETFTITWVNWNGTVLETDRNVAKNTMPTYDGATPTKPEDEQYTYEFTGWNPEVVVAVADATYTAQYRSNPKGGQEEPPETNNFVNKKLITTNVQTNIPGGDAISGQYANSYASLFDDGTFELINVLEEGLQAMLGTYSVAESGNSATLTVSKFYDNEDGYSSAGSSYSAIALTFENNSYTLVIPQGTYNITITLRDSGEQPTHYNLPNDPNAHGDAKYHVNKSDWEDIMFNHALVSGNYNLTVAYTSFYINGTLKIDNSKFEVAGDPGTYYEKDNDGKFSVYHYNADGLYWKVTNDVQLGADYFDEMLGVLPLAFEDMSFSDGNTYYYRSSYRYYPDQENEPSVYTDYSNVRVYFEDGDLKKISYTTMGQNLEFVYSNHRATTVTLPSETTPIDVTQYYPDVQNKVFGFDHLTGDNAEVMTQVYTGSKMSVFNDNSAELFIPHSYTGSGVSDVETCVFGSISFRANSYSNNNGDPYIMGDFRTTSVAIGGVANSTTGTYAFKYYVTSKKVQVSVGGNVIWLNITDQTPEHYEVEPPEAAQWPADKVSAFLTSIGATSSVVPALEGATSYFDYTGSDYMMISCVFASAEAMETAHTNYTALLARSFEYSTLYSSYYDDDIMISANKVVDSNAISIYIAENNYIVGSGYPDAGIAAFVEGNSITDPIPDFRYDGASYTTVDSSATSFTFMIAPPAETTTDTLVTHYKSILDGSENFAYVMGEGGYYMYSSLTGQYSVMFGAVEGFVMVNFSCDESPLTNQYPSEGIAAYFEGVTDKYIDFSTDLATTYGFMTPEEEDIDQYAQLYIVLDEEVEAEDVVTAYINSLGEMGYGLKTSEDYGEMYVSTNKQIGFKIDYFGNEIMILMFNLTKISQTFTVNYILYNSNNWNIYTDNPQFYAWVWGGSYGMGQWIELEQQEDDGGNKYFTLNGIDDDATGMKIVRFAADSVIAFSGDGVNIYNQTGDISLVGNHTAISFAFNG